MTRDPVVAVAEILWFRHNRVRDGVGDFYAEAREIVAAAVESIAAGFDSLADAAKTVDREHRDVDVVLAHQAAARFVRNHTGNRFPSAAAAVSSPGGTPGAREHINDGAVPSMAELTARLREIHWPIGAPDDEGPVWCACCKPWPCPTELALRATESATSPTGDPTP